MRTIEIQGQDFSSLEAFYKTIEKFLMEGECPWGANLDSLDEIVSCQFNYTEDRSKDVIKIVWHNFNKSKSELIELKGGRKAIEVVSEIFSSNESIEFIKID